LVDQTSDHAGAEAMGSVAPLRPAVASMASPRRCSALRRGTVQQDGWISIADAIQRVSESIGDTNKAGCYPDALAAIRAAAYDGKISMRGRKQLPSRGDFRSRDAYSDLRTDIESVYWRNSVLNAYSTSPQLPPDYHTQPESVKAWGPAGPDERNHYADLVVSALDLFRQWPTRL
jgi:hypothetical protein